MPPWTEAELLALTPQQQAADIAEALAYLGEIVLAWQSGLPVDQRHPRLLSPYARCTFLCVQCGVECAIAALMDPGADPTDLDAVAAAATDAVRVYGGDEHVAAAVESLRAVAFHRRSLVRDVQWLHRSRDA